MSLAEATDKEGAAGEAFDQISFIAGMGLAVPAISIVNPHHAYGLTGLLLVLATVIAAATAGRSHRSDSAPSDTGGEVRLVAKDVQPHWAGD